MKQRFAGGDSNGVYDIVTGDESWIYCNDPETKRQYAQWVFVAFRGVESRRVGKKSTTYFFGTTGIEILVLPSYSPDLAPCAFYLLSKIIEKLRGKWFTVAEEAVAPYEKAAETTPKRVQRKCFS
ncbi:hypothetical protein EVAR_17075_1 [Eumeta japonica]|uniref:Mariner Mos1 transposase n=1 Tax=Eumeta variegata TaxID=151549 RepID=A0A4C1V683_EUMVA|nr:hypothetical protein EVAR_17075_1 [Eumeta japonica]